MNEKNKNAYEKFSTEMVVKRQKQDFKAKWGNFKEEHKKIMDELKKNPNCITQEEKTNWNNRGKQYNKELKERKFFEKTFATLDKINEKRKEKYIETHGEQNFVDFDTFIRLYFSKQKNARSIIDKFEPTRIKAARFDLIEQGESGYSQLIKDVGISLAKDLKMEYQVQKDLSAQMPLFDEKFKDSYYETSTLKR